MVFTNTLLAMDEITQQYLHKMPQEILPVNISGFTSSLDDVPVISLVNQIITDAITQGVSDIHFEPYEQSYRIRYRKDGLLFAIASPPLHLSTRIAARIKIMSNLDISERRMPQDGRFKMEQEGIHCRVSTCPTVNGEKIVLRLLNIDKTRPDIKTLGLTKVQQKQFHHAITRSQGMILITGPTGSGKTMTLYSALTQLNTGTKNISTVEDPVEIMIKGINQISINPKVGLTFSKTLRTLVRQDPDVIMIGEIRDSETADLAIKAAQTGHLVLSTLHTNGTAESITRLINLGIDYYNLASGISLILAQRLLRRLCDHCKVFSHSTQSYQAQACHHCNQGYLGRMAIFEVMPISKTIKHLILSGEHTTFIKEQAQTEGMLTLSEVGLAQVKMGLTSMEELNGLMD